MGYLQANVYPDITKQPVSPMIINILFVFKALMGSLRSVVHVATLRSNDAVCGLHLIKRIWIYKKHHGQEASISERNDFFIISLIRFRVSARPGIRRRSCR